jgi:hypothetical protein
MSPKKHGIRTQEEVDKEMKSGEEFVRDHPYSMFGTDNVRQFKIFKEVIKMCQSGTPRYKLDDFINNYEDEENGFAYAVLEWFFDNGDPIYTEE